MDPPVFRTLHANDAVKALVADRIYKHGNAPQNVEKPYITWFLVLGDPENTLDEAPRIDRDIVQIDCWDTDGKCISDLAKAVRNALEKQHHMTGVIADSFESETKLYRHAMTFDFWTPRE